MNTISPQLSLFDPASYSVPSPPAVPPKLLPPWRCIPDGWREPRLSLLATLARCTVPITRAEVDAMLEWSGRPDGALEESWAHYEAVTANAPLSFDNHCRFPLVVSGTIYTVDYFPPKSSFSLDKWGDLYKLCFTGPKDGDLTATGYYGPIFMGPRPAFPSPLEFAQQDAEKHIRDNAPRKKAARRPQ